MFRAPSGLRERQPALQTRNETVACPLGPLFDCSMCRALSGIGHSYLLMTYMMSVRGHSAGRGAEGPWERDPWRGGRRGLRREAGWQMGL